MFPVVGDRCVKILANDEENKVEDTVKGENESKKKNTTKWGGGERKSCRGNRENFTKGNEKNQDRENKFVGWLVVSFVVGG